jgi:hypothetical protein
MSRSGYTDECDYEYFPMWRGQVASAIRGRRGQKFLRDLIDGLDALPEKVLIDGRLQEPDTGCVCALGAVGLKRGIALAPLESFAEVADNVPVAKAFDIAVQLACEIQWENDEGGPFKESPEARWQRIRRWAASNLNPEFPPKAKIAEQP